VDLTKRRAATRQRSQFYCHAELAASFLVIASTRWACPRQDGQAELAQGGHPPALASGAADAA